MKKNILCLTILLTVILIVAIPTVLATNDTAPVFDEETFADLFVDFGKILPPMILAALVTSMLGYMRKTDPEQFELSKFAATCVIGLLIGLLTLKLGWSYATAQEYLANSGLTIYIYWTCKIVAKKAGWISNNEVIAPDKPPP